MTTKHKLLALTFLVAFIISLSDIPVTPMSESYSQTRGVKPQASFATTSQSVLANAAPTYTYGNSTSGTYLKTWTSNNDYHISTASSYVSSGTYFELATGAPTYTYGSSISGTYQDTWTSNNVYHVSTSSSYNVIDGGRTKATTSWTEWNAVGTVNWTYETYAQSGDNQYAQSYGATLGGTDISYYLRGVGFGFSVSGTVSGIYITIEKHKHDYTLTDVTDYIVRLLKAGSLDGSNYASGTSWGTSDANSYYGGSSDLWGTTWSAADIDNANFGMVISVLLLNSPDYTAEANIDYICITVYMLLTYYRIDFNYPFQLTEVAKTLEQIRGELKRKRRRA